MGGRRTCAVADDAAGTRFVSRFSSRVASRAGLRSAPCATLVAVSDVVHIRDIIYIRIDLAADVAHLVSFTLHVPAGDIVQRKAQVALAASPVPT